MAAEAPNSRLEELVLLAEYKELLSEAILTGNKELVASIKRRISILEAGFPSSKIESRRMKSQSTKNTF